MTDLDLVRLAAGGDGSAFNALVDRHGAELFQLAASLSRTRADAEDIVQETLIGALKGLSKFDARASVKTWLKRILVRQAARAWNRSKRWRETRPMDTVEQSPGPALGVPSSTPSVDRRLDVAAVLATLSPEHREVLVLREFQQMSYSEMADVLDVPQGTIESRLHRARAELRSKLNGYNA